MLNDFLSRLTLTSALTADTAECLVAGSSRMSGTQRTRELQVELDMRDQDSKRDDRAKKNDNPDTEKFKNKLFDFCQIEVKNRKVNKCK